MAKHQFQTEVNQLLHLIIHSLYSHKEIFIRELISNASDALDKLKHLTLTDDQYKSLNFDPRIDIFFQEGDSASITIADTGIGMNQQELEENLGTIARSGTRNFIQTLSGDAKKDSNLIGQFGVGFYSSFMVADRVQVISLKAGEDKAWLWESDGRGEYEIEEAYRDVPGTAVTLYLNPEGKEYSSRWALEGVIKKYSNHIPFPIFLHYEDTKFEEENGEKVVKSEQKVEQINSASAIWKRPKSELSDEDYRAFYGTISHDFGEAIHWVHTHAEGTLDYTTLFYIPEKAPMDMFRSDYRPGVKLYVKRVFITDDEKELLPVYLRFVRGVIDSEDLPLNVSREILQQNRVMAKIRSSSVKKILGELESIQKNERGKYDAIYEEYRIPLKEGIYQDYENKQTLTNLLMFRSTKVEGYTTLAEYVSRLAPDQKAIYYITGTIKGTLKNSPLLELYKKKDIEVLIMEDEVDELVISTTLSRYEDFELKSVNRSDAAESLKTEEDREAEKTIEPLLARIREALGDRIKDVKASIRLSDSPSCIVADEKDPTAHMQNIMKAMGQAQMAEFKPILEINPRHEIVKKLESVSDADVIKDISFLLLEQAMILEGMEINPGDFIGRLNRVMNRSL